MAWSQDAVEAARPLYEAGDMAIVNGEHEHAARLILHLEGAALLFVYMATYAYLDFSWWTFAPLFLLPDLALLLYPVGLRAASIVYNLAHTTVFPIGLAAFSLLAGSDPALRVALIWFAHIGMDRAVGYGLKYGEVMKVNHLNRV